MTHISISKHATVLVNLAFALPSWHFMAQVQSNTWVPMPYTLIHAVRILATMQNARRSEGCVLHLWIGQQGTWHHGRFTAISSASHFLLQIVLHFPSTVGSQFIPSDLPLSMITRVQSWMWPVVDRMFVVLLLNREIGWNSFLLVKHNEFASSWPCTRHRHVLQHLTSKVTNLCNKSVWQMGAKYVYWVAWFQPFNKWL